jgi:hypothetical protein
VVAAGGHNLPLCSWEEVQRGEAPAMAKLICDVFTTDPRRGLLRLRGEVFWLRQHCDTFIRLAFSAERGV